jgi:phenylalanine ammonia-lyase
VRPTLTITLSLAVDIRAMQAEFKTLLKDIVYEEMLAHFHTKASMDLRNKVFSAMIASLDNTATMDAGQRMVAVAASSAVITSNAFAQHTDPPSLPELVAFRTAVASRAAPALVNLRKAFLSGARGSAPGSTYLGRTRPVYDFVRNELGVRMHGEENRTLFIDGLGSAEPTIGQNVSLIYEVRAAVAFPPHE